VSKIVNNIASVQTVFPAAWQSYNAYINQQIGCYVGLWVVVPMYIVSILCVGFLFFRFFVLQWFAARTVRTQEMRRDLLSSPNKTGANVMNRAKIIDRIIKLSMSPWMIALAITVCVLSVYMVGAIDLGRQGDQVRCTDEWSKDQQYAAVLARYEIIVIVIIVIITIIQVLFDLIANGFFKKLFKREITFRQFLIELFMESDPLRYRMELYLMAIPGACLGLILGIFGIVSSIQGQAEYFNLIKQFLYVFLWEYPSMLVLPGVVLICAIKWNRRENLFKNKKGDLLNSAMSPDMAMYAEIDIATFNDAPGMMHRLLGVGDVETYDMFKDFTKKEFSVENVLIYDDLRSYEAIPAEEKERRYDHWCMIRDSYLLSSSLNEVNIPRKIIDATKQKAEAYEKDKENCTMPDDLLSSIMDVTIQNLTDSYCRFFYSDTFQRYINKRKRKTMASV
jgi:hypothetical protein